MMKHGWEQEGETGRRGDKGAPSQTDIKEQLYKGIITTWFACLSL